MTMSGYFQYCNNPLCLYNYIIDEWSSYACIMMVSVVFLLSVQALKEIEEVGDLLLLKK